MDEENSYLVLDPSELDRIRANVLQSQIQTYRLLARNLPVSEKLIHSCSLKYQLANLICEHLQQSSTTNSRKGIVLKEKWDTSNANVMEFPSSTALYRWLMGSNEDQHEEFIPKRIRQHPLTSNPLYLQQEREKR